MSRKKINLNVDLYKPSGKWGYGFTVEVSMPAVSAWVDSPALLAEIAECQNHVTPELITGGAYIVVIKETEETMNDPEYKGFLCRLVHNTK